MIFLDSIFRFSGVGLLALLAVLAWRGRGNWRSAPYLILSCLSVAALYLGYAPPAILPPEPILTLARLLDVPHLVFVWLFALSLFAEKFELRAQHVVIGLLYAAPILWIRLGDLGWIAPPPRFMIPIGSVTSIALIGHLIWATLRGRRDDLLERRRAVRVYFVLTISAVAVAAALTDLIQPDAAIDRRTAKAIAIWPAIVFGTFWMLSFDQLGMRFGADMRGAVELSAGDAKLWNRLTAMMEDNHAYREPTLTIVSLARELGVGQHKLRSLINTRLGFANFNQFLNHYRIEDVKQSMVDPAKSDTPILTLAMDAGFTSLSPFNKAFKELTGSTPTEFRKSGSPD